MPQTDAGRGGLARWEESRMHVLRYAAMALVVAAGFAFATVAWMV